MKNKSDVNNVEEGRYLLLCALSKYIVMYISNFENLEIHFVAGDDKEFLNANLPVVKVENVDQIMKETSLGNNRSFKSLKAFVIVYWFSMYVKFQIR